MDRVKEMFHDLSPLARLDEMHPTLAKFSIPAGGDMDDGSSSGLASGGLSLSKAFEAIESKKHELQVKRFRVILWYSCYRITNVVLSKYFSFRDAADSDLR